MRMYQDDERRFDFHGLGLALKQAREARAAAICLRLQRIVQTGKSGEVSSSEMRREFFAGVGVPRAHCPLYTDVNREI